MARNDVFLNINALSPADAVVTGQQDMTAATVPELVLGDTPTFNFYFTDNTNVWPSWAGNASYTLTWALSDAVAGDFAPAATTGNATPITGGWSVILPLNSYDLVGLLNTKRVGQPYPVQNLWQQLRVTDPSGNEVTRAMFWTPVRYRAISDTQNTESASPTGGRFVTVNNVNSLTTPTAAQFYAANQVPTSALGTAANGELLIGNGTGFTKATLTAGSGVSITNGSGSITITATDGDITLDDGTAAAPSLKFTADTDTGLFRPSDNVVGISAGGVSRATFGATSAINGTTIPSSKTLVVTTDKLSALAATTSAELAGVISDETGSGALVFANTPTLVTPNIGAATGTSFNLTGSGTLGTTLTVNGTTDSSSKDTGAIVTEGGLGVEKSATIGGNLTVSGGTGTIDATSGTASATLNLVGRSSGTAKTASVLANSGGSLVLGAEGAGSSLTIAANTGNTTVAYNLTVSGTASVTGQINGSAGYQFRGATGTTYELLRYVGGTNNPGIFATVNESTKKVTIFASGSLVSGQTLGLGAEGSEALTLGAANATIAGNLTVSGTGNSSFAGSIRLPWSTPSLLSYYDATYSLGFVFDSTNRKLVLRAQSADAPANGKGTIAFESGATPSEIARFAPSTGNLLLKSDGVDSSNGRLQLATHTTSAGGIGFGTDISLYRDTNSTLNGTAPGGYALARTGINGVGLATGVNVASDAKTANDAIGISLSLQNSASAAKVYGQIYAEINSPTAASENGSLVFRTIGSGTVKAALTLDSSQNATFNGGTITLGDYTGDQDVIIAAQSTGVGYLRWRPTASGTNAYGFSIAYDNPNTKLSFLRHEFSTAGTEWLSVARATGVATFANAIAIGNTVNTVSPTSPNRTITMVIGGTTYYIHAKTTND